MTLSLKHRPTRARRGAPSLLSAWLVLLCGVFGNEWVHAQTWVEDTFEDFADGQLDASGQNMYVSRDGKIRTIHRFDLNQDGHLDLIFNSTHDTWAFIPATLCTIGAERKLQYAPLSVEGSKRVAMADLNHDGHLDLVFVPNASGIQHPRRFLTIIWGGDDGWPAYRSNGILPVYGCRAVAVADLNHDGWPDIVALNGEAWLPGQPPGKIVRIFWGGQRGFVLSRRQDIGVKQAVDLAAGDFDRSGARDLAVLTSERKIRLLWAKAAKETPIPPEMSEIPLPGNGARCLTAADCDGDGQVDLAAGTDKGVVYIVPGGNDREWGRPIEIEGPDASQIAVGNLDGDRYPDMVLTRLSLAKAGGGEAAGAAGQADDSVRILWGGRKGFSASRSTTIAAAHAAASAIGDLDGDGRADLAVAVHQGSEAFAAESFVFFNVGQRRFHRSSKGVRTEGASDVAIAPREGKLPARAVFCNSRGGTLGEQVPLLVYWGDARGFDANRRWEIPFTSGYEASAADLNADGFADLIALNSGHAGKSAEVDPYLGVNIFWGSADGFDPKTRRATLREGGLGTSNVADLNKDGYLDLVLGGFGSARKGASEPLVIYYGGADGFDGSRRVGLKSETRAIGCALADFDRNDWLDIAVVCYEQERLRVFWGGPDGFDNSRTSDVDAPGAIDLETADLNGDGWLDVIVACYADKKAKHHDTGMLIFWGNDRGFQPWNAQWLPGFTPVGPTVADFDGDGFLDVFSPHYHAELTRESLPSYLYWGGPDGFATRRRSILICDSAHDAQTGDFDGDGRLDLAVSCHTRDGNHYTNSKVFYNDGNRFANPRVTLLPTHGTHWMWNQDMGHVYDRQWRQTYESSVFTWDGPAGSGKLEFDADVPDGTEPLFSIRTAASKEEIETRPWQAVTSGDFSIKEGHRCLQYRVVLKSDNGDRYPVVDRVAIELARK